MIYNIIYFREVLFLKGTKTTNNMNKIVQAWRNIEIYKK